MNTNLHEFIRVDSCNSPLWRGKLWQTLKIRKQFFTLVAGFIPCKISLATDERK